MSALGQTQTSDWRPLMSAFLPKAHSVDRAACPLLPLAEVGTILETLAISMRVASQHSLTSFRTDLM